MAVNKVVYKDKTLIDLTNDTVTPMSMLENTTAHSASGQTIVGAIINLSNDTVSPSTLKKGITAHDATGAKIVGTMESGVSGGVNTSDATAVSGDILSGKTAYINGGKVTGTMPNKSNSGTVYISNANLVTKIPRGYYDGNVRVDIDSNSYRNLYADNIREGVTILGVTGTMKASQAGSVRSANGTTVSQNINTGLNKIDYLFLYTDKISGIGVVSLSFNATKNECSLTFCGDYSVYSKYCNTIIRQPFTVSGGIVNWTETMTEYCFMSGATYSWVAIGS